MKNERRGSEYSLPESDYEALLNKVTEAGCFRRTYLQHTMIFLVAVAGLSFSFYLLTVTDNLWIQLANASLAAFFTVQLGLLGHELSHNSIFKSKKINRNLAVIVWGLGCGLSEGRWYDKHSAHHQSPNHIGHDPDLEIPFVFSGEQANLRSEFFQRFMLPYQHLLFWVGLWFVYPFNILNSMRFLFRDLTWRSGAEIVLIFIHYLLVIKITFFFLPTVTAVLFNLTALLLMGIYMGLAFAPNHKGEDMLLPQQKFNWVHQITLTRNLNPTPLTKYVFGGIEHQVEHHLFPTMSRFQYPMAEKIVKNFCFHNNIPYHETSWSDSLQQIHTSLHAEATK